MGKQKSRLQQDPHVQRTPRNDVTIDSTNGWLVVDLPLWKMMEFVSWDADLPNWMESHKSHVPNHPGIVESRRQNQILE